MPAWNKDLGRRDNMRVLGQSLFTQGRKRFTQAKDVGIALLLVDRVEQD